MTSVLLPKQDAEVIQSVQSDETIGDAGIVSPNGDFVVTILDLRLRIMMLVGCDASSLDETEPLQEAQRLLWLNPDTIACVIVADDDRLTCRIVEYGDTPVTSTHRSSVLRKRDRVGPLRSLMHSYLETIDRPWPPAFSSLRIEDLDFEEFVRERGRAEVEERRSRGARIPELLNARRSLNEEDIDWVVGQTMSILRGEALILDSELTDPGDLNG